MRNNLYRVKPLKCWDGLLKKLVLHTLFNTITYDIHVVLCLYLTWPLIQFLQIHLIASMTSNSPDILLHLRTFCPSFIIVLFFCWLTSLYFSSLKALSLNMPEFVITWNQIYSSLFYLQQAFKVLSKNAFLSCWPSRHRPQAGFDPWALVAEACSGWLTSAPFLA